MMASPPDAKYPSRKWTRLTEKIDKRVENCRPIMQKDRCDHDMSQMLKSYGISLWDYGEFVSFLIGGPEEDKNPHSWNPPPKPEANPSHTPAISKDAAGQILMSCESNAWIIARGDAETFPFWQVQEIDGIRRDVQIINLSLIATGWYRKAVLDLENQPDSLSNALAPYLKGPTPFPHDTTLHLPVDTAVWLAQGNIPAEKRNQIVSPMHWNIPPRGENDEKHLLPEDFALMNLIAENAANQWEHAIYFYPSAYEKNLLNLRPWLHKKGELYQLLPIPNHE